jgi:hypothetical protein
MPGRQDLAGEMAGPGSQLQEAGPWSGQGKQQVEDNLQHPSLAAGRKALLALIALGDLALAVEGT